MPGGFECVYMVVLGERIFGFKPINSRSCDGSDACDMYLEKNLSSREDMNIFSKYRHMRHLCHLSK
jgi:hypothetical protein